MNQVAQPAPKDLVVLVADKNIEAVVSGLLARPEALGIRPVNYDCNPQRDRAFRQPQGPCRTGLPATDADLACLVRDRSPMRPNHVSIAPDPLLPHLLRTGR